MKISLQFVIARLKRNEKKNEDDALEKMIKLGKAIEREENERNTIRAKIREKEKEVQDLIFTAAVCRDCNEMVVGGVEIGCGETDAHGKNGKKGKKGRMQKWIEIGEYLEAEREKEVQRQIRIGLLTSRLNNLIERVDEVGEVQLPTSQVKAAEKLLKKHRRGHDEEDWWRRIIIHPIPDNEVIAENVEKRFQGSHWKDEGTTLGSTNQSGDSVERSKENLDQIHGQSTGVQPQPNAMKWKCNDK